jgi:hypothetical protein
MAHDFKDNPHLAEVIRVNSSVGETGKYDTHLTVDRGRGIESEHVKDYSHEGAHACQGINLLRGMMTIINLSDSVKCDRKVGQTHIIHR